VFDVDDVYEQVLWYGSAHCAHAAPHPTKVQKGGQKEEKRDKLYARRRDGDVSLLVQGVTRTLAPPGGRKIDCAQVGVELVG